MTNLFSTGGPAVAKFRGFEPDTGSAEEAAAPDRRLAPAVDMLLAAWRGAAVLDELPVACRPADIAEGHFIQDLLVDRLGRDVRGWKLAVTSDAALAKTGLAGPIYGRLFDGDIVRSPATLAAANFHGAKMEPEFAVRLARPLGGAGTEIGRADVEAAIEGLYLAIELAATRYTDSDAVGFASQVADNAGTGALVLGPAVENWDEIDLRATPVSMLFDDRPVAEGFPAAERCDPVAVVAWLANELALGGLCLNPGDVVTTGTLAQPTYCDPGTHGCARFAGLGEVRLTFA